MNDPLGVLTSTRAVTRQSAHVSIDTSAIQRLVAELLRNHEQPVWDADLHYRATGDDADERTAMWILLLDALNFCFWGQGSDPSQRWRVRWKGELVDGYVALVASLTHAVENNYPLHDARYLSTISESDVSSVLAPEQGHTEIPLLNDRVVNIREMGNGLLSLGPKPATVLITSARGSAIAFVNDVVYRFPSFNDVTVWPYGETGLPQQRVRFYKRAQILVGDLSGGLAGSGLANFHDLDLLTAFADYKVPQILRELDVLVYDQHLSQLVDSRIHLPAGSREEIEIRAATIVACDLIVARLCEAGMKITAASLDWLLWSKSQDMPIGSRPYHLTPTIFY